MLKVTKYFIIRTKVYNDHFGDVEILTKKTENNNSWELVNNDWILVLEYAKQYDNLNNDGIVLKEFSNKNSAKHEIKRLKSHDNVCDKYVYGIMKRQYKIVNPLSFIARMFLNFVSYNLR